MVCCVGAACTCRLWGLREAAFQAVSGRVKVRTNARPAEQVVGEYSGWGVVLVDHVVVAIAVVDISVNFVAGVVALVIGVAFGIIFSCCRHNNNYYYYDYNYYFSYYYYD